MRAVKAAVDFRFVRKRVAVFGFHEEGLSVEAAVIKEVGKGWWEVKLPSGEKAQVHSKSLEQAMAKRCLSQRAESSGAIVLTCEEINLRRER